MKTTKQRMNLNHYIYVKLNDEGRKIYAKYYKMKPSEVNVDSEGYTKVQAWELIDVFPKNYTSYYDMNILVDSHNLTEVK